MAEPFLAEVRMVGFNFPPRGWAFCDGQILPINQNQSLYSLLGTIYGGDGRTSFALPDLRGRTPMHTGSDGFGPFHSLGQKSGEEYHTLTAAEMPQHNHTFRVSSQEGTFAKVVGNVYSLTDNSNIKPYSNALSSTSSMNSGVIAHTGGGQAHNNMQPYTTVNFCIALQGTFPPRN